MTTSDAQPQPRKPFLSIKGAGQRGERARRWSMRRICLTYLMPAGLLASWNAAGLAHASSMQAEATTPPPAIRIVNGERAGECEWPAVVSMDGCTGTLIHPRVVLYAAHCGAEQKVRLAHRIFRATQSLSGGRELAIERCEVNKKYKGSKDKRYDWAFCLLKEGEVRDDFPIIPIATGCETDMVRRVGQDVTQCGFGHASLEKSLSPWSRKRYGVSRISDIRKGVIEVGDHNGVVACAGDSGGPLLARLPDGSWRTMGITSTYNHICGFGGSNKYADAAEALPWLEERSGIDLSPCFRGNGSWSPGPRCGGFFAQAPGESKGRWSNSCQGTSVSGYSSTCGDAWSGSSNTRVVIAKPENNARFNHADSIEVVALVSEPVPEKMELLLNDQSQGILQAKPFRWELKGVAPGSHRLKVRSDDGNGVNAVSELVRIRVEAAKPEDKSDDKPDKPKDEPDMEDEGSDSGEESGADGSEEDSDKDDGKGSSSKKGKEGKKGSTPGKNKKEPNATPKDEPFPVLPSYPSVPLTEPEEPSSGCRMSGGSGAPALVAGWAALLLLGRWARRRRDG